MSEARGGYGPGARAGALTGAALLLAGALPTLGFYSLQAFGIVLAGSLLAGAAVLWPGWFDRQMATPAGRRAAGLVGPALLLYSAWCHALEPQPSPFVAPFGGLAFLWLLIALLRPPGDGSPLAALLPGLLLWSPAAALLETRLMFVERPAGVVMATYGWLAALVAAPLVLWLAGNGRAVRAAGDAHATTAGQGRPGGVDRRGLALAVLLGLGLLVRGGAIVASPSPVIDVFALLEQRPRDLLAGQNPYAARLASPYQTPRAARFRVANQQADDDPPWYPPGFLGLGLLATLLRVDPRAWLVVTAAVATALAARWGRSAIGRREAWLLAGCVAWLPSATFSTEQSWMDPVWAVAMAAAFLPGPAWLTGLLAGGALTLKQTALLALPALGLRWRRKPLALAIALAVTAGAVLPFILWSPADFLHDTVTGFLTSPLPATGLCLPAAILAQTGRLIPTGPLLLVGVVTVLGLAWVSRGAPARLLAASGAGLALFSLLNKYAFLNFYEAAALLLYLSVALPAGLTEGDS